MFTKTLTVLLLCLTSLSFHTVAKPIASDELNVMPLMNGQTLPSTQVRNLAGDTVDLLTLTQGKPSIIFFYRGGWCPFCNSQMGQLKEIEPKLVEMGFQLIGISPDSPEKLKASMIDQDLAYTLLSDSQLNAMQAFGLAYYTSEKTTQRYLAKLKLDHLLNVTSEGDKRLVLPVPAIYISDAKGLIHFQYVNPNFRVRPSAKLIETAASLVPM